MKRFLFSTLFIIFACSSILAKQQIPFVDSTPYDTIVGDKQVKLYTITNGTVGAQITNLGGFIVTLFAPDKDGNYANLVTNYPNIKQYFRYNLGMVGPSLGRFANRIANAKFTLDGKEYELTKNSGQHILHGGNNGFDHTIWTVEKASKSELILSCVLEDGLDGFPGTLKTTLTYSITKDNGLSISYKATTDKPTVVNLSNHPYFNLNGVGNGDILGHILTINADNITEVDRMNIPTGKFTSVDGTPYDFRKPTLIGDRQIAMQGFRWGQPRPEIPEGKVMNYDHNFCLNHSAKGDKKGSNVEKVAELYSPQSGRVMEIWNDKPGLQLYTGARTAIAMESQNYPDAPNHSEFPSPVLRPGEAYSHTCIYKFKIK